MSTVTIGDDGAPDLMIDLSFGVVAGTIRLKCRGIPEIFIEETNKALNLKDDLINEFQISENLKFDVIDGFDFDEFPKLSNYSIAKRKNSEVLLYVNESYPFYLDGIMGWEM